MKELFYCMAKQVHIVTVKRRRRCRGIVGRFVNTAFAPPDF